MPHAIDPEDQARADFYALLGRLFAAPPDPALLEAIANASPLPVAVWVDEDHDGEADLGPSWDALREASAAMPADAAKVEYDELFVGVGKCAVNLHASHWLTGFMMDKPLVEVRATLAHLGLARREQSSLVEDHVASLFETMRVLIAGQGARPPAALEEQRAFFDRHLAPWVLLCCAATSQISVANYYRRVAQFAYCYMVLERDSLAMD